MTSPLANALAKHRACLAQAQAALAADEGKSPDGPAPTAEAAGIRRIAKVLSRMPPPVPPPALSAPACYEGILERATEASARAIGAPLLRAAFEPAVPDRDVAWVDAGESRIAERALRRAPRAPGWLWARIRADLEATRPAAGWRRWHWVAAAAAVVLAGLFAAHDGTPSFPELVFQPVDRPLTVVAHPSDLIRDLGR